MNEECGGGRARALLGAPDMIDPLLRGQTAAPRRHSWLGHLLRFVFLGGAALVLALPALGTDGTEFACEETVAHLADCCPNLDPHTVDCTYDAFQCDTDANPNPQLSREASECLQSMSCEVIAADDGCEHVAAGELPSCGT
jgi:hypothetical protein